MSQPTLTIVEELLRDPGAVSRRIDGDGRESLVRASLLVIIAGAAAFGAAIGGFRGGVQIVYAAAKLPLVLLFTCALAVPALWAVRSALGRDSSLPRDAALLVSGVARCALVLAGLAPLVLLGLVLELRYHQMALVLLACAAIAGVPGLLWLWRGLADHAGRARLTAAIVVLCSFAAVGSQVAWTLRPYLLRPRTAEVPLVRCIEGSVWSAAAQSVRSARGVYRGEADLPEGGCQ